MTKYMQSQDGTYPALHSLRPCARLSSYFNEQTIPLNPYFLLAFYLSVFRSLFSFLSVIGLSFISPIRYTTVPKELELTSNRSGLFLSRLVNLFFVQELAKILSQLLFLCTALYTLLHWHALHFSWWLKVLVFAVVYLVIELSATALVSRFASTLLPFIFKPFLLSARVLAWFLAPPSPLFPVIRRFLPKKSPLEWACRDRELAVLIQAEDENLNVIERIQRRLIRNVQSLPDTPVEKVMTPRSEIFALSSDVSREDVLRHVLQEEYSRVPVYAKDLDDIQGMLYAKDLLTDSKQALSNLLRPIHFVSAHQRVDDLFREFKQERIHIAIVVDEHGGTAGLVTMEDLLEEIFGEIQDEHDEEYVWYHKVSEGEYIISAQAELEQCTQLLSCEFEGGDERTLGGFLLHRFGEVPKVGDSLEYSGLLFRVVRADPHRILDIHVRPQEQST